MCNPAVRMVGRVMSQVAFNQLVFSPSCNMSLIPFFCVLHHDLKPAHIFAQHAQTVQFLFCAFDPIVCRSGTKYKSNTQRDIGSNNHWHHRSRWRTRLFGIGIFGLEGTFPLNFSRHPLSFFLIFRWQVCRKEPVPDFAPPPLMIPELKMLFAVSNDATSAPKPNADAKLHIVDAQSIDAAREKYRDWWHGRTEKAPIAVV